MDNYNLKVNDTFSFVFEKQRLLESDIVATSDNMLHILHQNIPYKAEMLSCDFYRKTYTVKLNHRCYRVQIENPLDILIKEMGFERGGTQIGEDVKAPMPGLILEIYVSIGQRVLLNDPLLVLGAMKMENCILSPREGVIKSIEIQKGDAVDKGQLLIEFE